MQAINAGCIASRHIAQQTQQSLGHTIFKPQITALSAQYSGCGSAVAGGDGRMAHYLYGEKSSFKVRLLQAHEEYAVVACTEHRIPRPK